MKNIYIIFLLLMGGVTYSFSQSPLVKQWDHGFGGRAADYLTCFQQTSDGGYILGGYISGDSATADTSIYITQHPKGYIDYWIVKTNGLGIKQWDKRFGVSYWSQRFKLYVHAYSNLYSIQQTKDGGYILGGSSTGDIGFDKTQPNRDTMYFNYDFWIIKVDSLGNKEWDKTFGGIGDDELTVIKQTGDGGYIVGGYSNSAGGDRSYGTKGDFDFWVLKIDANGIKQWDKDFGTYYKDVLVGINQTADSGYIFGGYTLDPSQLGYWVLKVNSQGFLQWEKHYGSGIAKDRMTIINRTHDGGYILGGSSSSGIMGDKSQPNRDPGGMTADYWVIKIDASGNEIWDKDFGGIKNEDEVSSIFQTQDGGYLFTGASYSHKGGDKSEDNLGNEQGWAVKTDSLGNKQWEKTLRTNSLTLDDENNYGIQTSDGCYAFANFTNSGIGGLKSDTNQGGYADYWLIKFCDSTLAVYPAAHFASSDTTVCANDCINFTDLSMNATSWYWTFDGAIPSSSSDQNPPNICYLSSGSYDVTLIASNSGGSNTFKANSFIRVIASPPAPTITKQSDTLFCSTDPSYIFYQWYDSTSIIPGSNDTFLVANHSGNYNVQVSNENGCSIAVGINVILGVNNEISDRNHIYIYPNPVANKFILLLGYGTMNSPTTVCISNLLGEIIYKSEIRNRRADIDMSQFSAGVYFVEVRSDNKNWVKKIIKQ